MAKRLLGTGRSSWVSPLLDIAIGAFGSVLVLLIFLLLFRRDDIDGNGGCEEIAFLGDVEPPPVIASQSYMFSFPATGGCGARLFTLSGELPHGLELDRKTGTVYGVAEASGASPFGRYEARFVVADLKGHRAERDAVFQLFPTAAGYDRRKIELLAESGFLPVARLGNSYSAIIGYRWGVPPFQWEVTGLPAGLQLVDGRIQGSPQQVGVFPVRVMVKQSSGQFTYRGVLHRWDGGSDEDTFELRVLPEERPTATFPPGRVGEPYLGWVSLGGIKDDESVTWVGQAEGLEPADNGRVLRGTPQRVAKYQMRYQVFRGDQRVFEDAVELSILPRRPAPSLGPTTFQAWLGEQTRLLVPTRGMESPVRLAVVSGALPPGLRIEEDLLVGVPTTAQLTDLELKAEDAQGHSAVGRITIRVGPKF